MIYIHAHEHVVTMHYKQTRTKMMDLLELIRVISTNLK